MRKRFLLINSLLIAIFMAGNLDAQFIVDESSTITWDFVVNKTADYSGSTEKFFDEDSVTLGSNLKYVGITSWKNYFDGGAILDFFTTITAVDLHYTAAKSDAVSFYINPLAGLTFLPTNISFACGRWGTSGGLVSVTWVSPNGTETLLANNIKPVLDNSEADSIYTITSVDVSSFTLPVSTGTCVLKIYIAELSNPKEVGLRDVVVEGDMFGEYDISVAHWNFEEGFGTIVTDVAGDSHGELYNAGESAWIDGRVGKGIDFTAKAYTDTACFITVPNSTSINFADTDFTVSALAKINDPKASGGETSLWSMGIPNVDNGGWYQLSFMENSLKFNVGDGITQGSPAGVLDGEILAGEWAHIVCVRDAANDLLSIYINGVLFDQSADLAGDISTDGNFYIGTVPFPGTGASTDFKGALDDIAIFDVALSAERILDLANGYGLGQIDPTKHDISFITDDLKDSVQVKWLETEGFNITEWWPAAGVRNITIEEIEALNASDLVIIGRSPGSSDLSSMKDVLNGIRTPVMNNNIWGSRSSKMNWFNSKSAVSEGDSAEIKNIHIKLPSDPIFSDVTLTAEDSLGMFSGPHDFLTIDGAILAEGNAEIVAANEGLVVVARFEPGAEFYPGSVDMPGMFATYWGMGNDASGWTNFFPLTDDGRDVYFKELARLIRLGEYVQPEMISFITDDMNDAVQIDWLESLGYMVNEWWPAEGAGSQTKEEIDILNASDLVIIGRSPESSEIGTMKDDINGLLVPVMNINIWASIKSYLNVFDSDNAGHEGELTAIKNIHIKLPSDPVFAGLALTVEDSLGIFIGPHDFLYIESNTLAASNAEVLASNDDLVAFARFAPNIEYYSGSIDMPAGYVTYWGMGNDVSGIHYFPLTDAAKLAYAKEISRLIGLGRTLSTDCSLSALSADPGCSIPIVPGSYKYSINVPPGTTEVTFTATPTNEDITLITGLVKDVSSLSEGSSKNARLRVIAEDGITQCTYDITVNMSTGIESESIDQITIYPNPTRSTLTVTNVLNAMISIYEIKGAQIRNIKSDTDQIEIEVADLYSGVYIMRIQMDDKVKVARFIKE